MKKFLFGEMNIPYREENGYLVLDIEMTELGPIGIWGCRHLEWLRKKHIARYTQLLTSFELNDYLYLVNEEAQELYDTIVAILSVRWGLTEDLRAQNQMKWARLANQIAQTAREIVDSEVVFV